MNDEELGRQDANDCFANPTTFDRAGPRTIAYARAALDALEQLQRRAPGALKALLEGGNQGARQLNADASQGLREIVQNADDLGANVVRFGVRRLAGKRQLLIVHDGSPVELMHVLPMIYPFLSTKRGSARLKGRFGIGLKTLNRIGSDLSVHGHPYHFGARSDLAVQVDPAPPVPCFYDPACETLVTLLLEEEVDDRYLESWFETWSASDLIFLNSVRSIELHDLDEARCTQTIAVRPLPFSSNFPLNVSGTAVSAQHLRFEVQGREWDRFVVEMPVPPGKRRADKATDDTSPIGIALPSGGDGKGRIHVALPTRISTGGAFSLDAQFDPATSREELVSEGWNQWLVPSVTEVLGALAVRLVQDGSPLAWAMVPVGAATDSTSAWLNERFAAGYAKAIAALSGETGLIDGRSLAEFAYCDADAEGLIDEADHADLAGAPMFPARLRDGGGRWREVLDAIGVSRRINLGDILGGCSTEAFDHKSADWFLSLARRCIDRGDSEHLLDARWVPLADGGRAWAQAASDATQMLVTAASDDGFASRHALFDTIHPLMLDEAHEDVRVFLAEEANLLLQVDASAVLDAATVRYAEEPLKASHQDLLDIRQLFSQVPDREPNVLGAAIGRAILIEAVRYQVDDAGKRRAVRELAHPAAVYLPASIDDEPHGWSRAAADTPGLRWASPGYAELFKISGRKQAARSLGRLRGAKRFLTLLGASTIPRLERVDTPVLGLLPTLQRPARQRIGQAEGILEDDYISPDLNLVLADMQTGSARVRRRKGQVRGSPAVDRAVALYRCLATNWESLEPFSTAYAVRLSRRGGRLEVAASWLAKLADAPWLVNEAGDRAAPLGLAIGTKVTNAIYADAAKFAAGLTETDAASPLARELGMEVDPPASELVRAIEQLRAGCSDADVGDLLRLYKALAGHCPQGSGTPSPETAISDLTVNSLRAKFGISRQRPGLISAHATTSPGPRWFAPTTVFAGKDIFHGRQPFVLPDRDLAPLWNALNISTPDLADCVRELESVAGQGSWPGRDALLIDIYRHVDRLVERTSAAGRRQLAALPLLSGDRWLTSRPLYACDHPGISLAAAHLWSAPCAVSTIRAFCAAAGVEPLPLDQSPMSLGYAANEELQDRFDAAVQILRADLARDDEAAYRAMEPWSRFDGMPLHIHSDGQLLVGAMLQGKSVPVSVKAHADVLGRAIHFDGESLIGRVEYGGYALAQFADPRHRRNVALAWVSAWATSADGTAVPTIALADEQAESSLDELAAQADRLKRSGGRRKMAGAATAGATGAKKAEDRKEVRRLKDLPVEFDFEVILNGEREGLKKGFQIKKGKPLRTEPPGPKAGAGSNQKPAPATAYRLYDSRQLQDRGWAHVRMAFEEGLIRIDDYQSTHGVGADGAIEWKRFLEMKSFAREAPGEVTLTEAEYKRAKERKERFLLVLVSGLEEGFATELRIYSDPLATLPWTPKGSISLAGLSGGRALTLTQRLEAGDPLGVAAE